MKTVASLISKIARLDLPLQFQELVPTLVGFSLGSNPPLDNWVAVETRLNTANALEAVFAEICTKRLLVDKKYVISVAQTYLSDLMEKGLGYSMEQLKIAESGSLTVVIEYATILAKIVHHLLLVSLSSLVDGARKGGSVYDLQETPAKAIDKVFGLLLSYIPLLRGHLVSKTTTDVNCINEGLKDLLKEFYELVVTTQKAHPIAFARFLCPFLELFYDDLEVMVSNNYQTESYLIIPQMTLLANVISCSYYTPEKSANEAVETFRSEIKTGHIESRAISSKGDVSINISAVESAVNSVWNDFLSLERIPNLVEISLFFMTLKESHLAEWAKNPEMFYIDRKNAVPEDDIISCAQNLYLSLVESKCVITVVEKIGAILLDTDAQLAAAQFEAGINTDSDALRSVVYWDAIYTSFGLSFNTFQQHSNFNVHQWFESSFILIIKALLEIPKQIPKRLPILRYRSLWLIGCSTSHQKNFHFIAAILNTILVDSSSDQNDIAVKLVAIEILHAIVYDPPDENFITYIHAPNTLISSIYNLASNCDEYLSKDACLEVVPLLLGCFTISGIKIDGETATAITSPLSQIWDNSVDENLLLRRSVISILSSVTVLVGKSHVFELHPIVLPLINHALDPKTQDLNSFLIEDALDLWLILLRLQQSYDTNFNVIFVRIQQLLVQDLEHVRKLMKITESYILIGSKDFFMDHSDILVNILRDLIGNVSPRGALYVNLVLESLLRKFPVEGALLLLDSGLAASMIQSCASNHRNEKGCEPGRVINIYLTVVSRIQLVLPGKFEALMLQYEKNNLFSFDQLIELYFNQFENINDNSAPLRQKLWAMCFLSFLQSSNCDMKLLKSMNSVLACCLSVFRNEEKSLTPFSVGYDSEEESFDAQQTLYETLINTESMKDIAFTTSFRQVCLESMRNLQNCIGLDAYTKLIQSVDPGIIEPLEFLLKE